MLSNIPDKIADIHVHFEQFKTALQMDFNYLKQVTIKIITALQFSKEN